MAFLEIIVTPEGQVELQTIGFSGPACRTASRSFEILLGIPSAEICTPEFHQPEGVSLAAATRLEL